jgi:hypothetical protein
MPESEDDLTREELLDIAEAAKELVRKKIQSKRKPGTGPSYRPNYRWTNTELSLYERVMRAGLL